MNVNIESPSTLRRKMTIELEPAEISRELDRAYNQLKRSVQLKGFRPGRVPRQLLERFFGDQVRGDVIQKLQKEYTEKALEENALRPVVEPEVTTEESDLKKPQFRFSATFDVKPEIVVRDYQDLKVPRHLADVTEQQVDEALERLRERSGTLQKIERHTVQPGDFVVASLEAFSDGKLLPNSRFDERLIHVSGAELAHGLEEVLNGAETGVETRKTRSYPDDYSEKELAGKRVEWRAKVNDIYQRVLPQLDDEFAKDQGEFQTLAELRDATRQQLERRAAEEADSRARQGLLDLIVERNPIDVPQSLIAREQRNLEAEFASVLEAGGMSREEAQQRAGENRDEWLGRAEKRAHSALIVDAIAEQENIQSSDDEVADRVAEMVSRAPSSQRQRLAELYSNQENRDALQQVMRREKTLDHLLARAQTESEPQSQSEPANQGASEEHNESEPESSGD